MKIKLAWLATPLLLLCVHLAQAQQEPPGGIRRIGFLSGGLPGPSHWTTKLRIALGELGYIDGKNIRIESRYSENNFDRLPRLADELVRLRLIVAGGRNDTRAAKDATSTIPIVGVSLLDPVADGLVESLARPGGNVTGFTIIAEVLVGKRLEFLKQAIPNLYRIGVLWNPQDPGSIQQWKQSQLAARELGVQLQSVSVSSADKLEAGFNEATAARSGALAMTASALGVSNIARDRDRRRGSGD